MKRTIILGLAGLMAAIVLVGCTKTDSVKTNPTKNPVDPKAAEEAKAKFILASEPAGAKGVKDIKKDAKDGDEIVVVGRIGGSESPFTAGRASFTIVDLSCKPCNEIEGDTCPIPWDYCCEPDLAKKTVLVKFVDSAGKTLVNDAKELFGVKELATLVIKGHARRDEESISVVATGFYIKKQ